MASPSALELALADSVEFEMATGECDVAEAGAGWATGTVPDGLLSVDTGAAAEGLTSADTGAALEGLESAETGADDEGLTSVDTGAAFKG